MQISNKITLAISRSIFDLDMAIQRSYDSTSRFTIELICNTLSHRIYCRERSGDGRLTFRSGRTFASKRRGREQALTRTIETDAQRRQFLAGTNQQEGRQFERFFYLARETSTTNRKAYSSAKGLQCKYLLANLIVVILS